MQLITSLFNCCGTWYQPVAQDLSDRKQVISDLAREKIRSPTGNSLPYHLEGKVLNQTAPFLQEFFSLFGCASSASADVDPSLSAKPKLLSTQMIWNGSPYNAFTDLIYFQNQYFCSFRVSNTHQNGENGKIRILSSPDAKEWTPVALLEDTGYDLRDPKFSVTPSGSLMLNMGATVWGQNGSEALNSSVSFSADGKIWQNIQILPYAGEWIWHVTWNNGIAYGCAYAVNGDNATMSLMQSSDGINYQTIKAFKIQKGPTETTLRFLPDSTMVALVRRDDGGGLIGTSPAPYTEWKWHNTKQTLGGPDFLILPNGKMWATSRQVQGTSQTTVLASMGTTHYHPVLTFPHGGTNDDCSYPGMVYQPPNPDSKEDEGGGTLYVSYYATQGKRTNIYLSVVRLP